MPAWILTQNMSKDVISQKLMQNDMPFWVTEPKYDIRLSFCHHHHFVTQF